VPGDSVRDDRVERITRAAIGVFARQGFSRTSMADLATAAGMSRPALYQYFENRGDVFRAALGAVLRDAADGAVAALEHGGDLTGRLAGYLAAAFGDPYEQLALAEHGDEIIGAKYEFAADLAAAMIADRRRRLEAHLRDTCGLRGRALRDAVDLVDLAPLGLKADAPGPDVYRRRLRALATSAAALVEASGRPTVRS
jgi:TetR/AcrR family transcriptional regulator